MNDKKKILLIGNTAWSMYNFRIGVAKALRVAGFEVLIAAPYDHTVALIRAEGFHHIDIKIDNKGISPKKDIMLLIDLYVLYKKFKPALIIHYTIKPNVYGGLAAKLANIKTISFVTGLGSMFIKQTAITNLIKLMYRISFSFSQRVWFLNHEDYIFFTKRKIVSDKKAEILPGEGIDTNSFSLIRQSSENPFKPQDRNAFRFLFLGRILKDKGILELIAAIRLVKHKYPHIECQVLGFIDALNPSAISEAQLREWINEGLVVYLGQSNDVKPYIAEADCIVLPSYREGISRTLLEAASMEKPIITTDVTGCRDVVDDGFTGFLCRVKDHNDLAEKMIKMLHLSFEQRILMGKNARKKVIKQFDEKLIIAKYLSTVQQLI